MRARSEKMLCVGACMFKCLCVNVYIRSTIINSNSAKTEKLIAANNIEVMLVTKMHSEV